MSSSVITIAGTKYAAGLYWQPSAEAKKIAKAAKQAARQPGFQADFYCVRQPTKSQPIGQFGLGIISAGHKQGMPSIAACLAHQRLGSWAGAFRVPEGIYFIAVREDLIDPDGDALFAEENEAQARLEQEIARGGIFDVVCPAEWGVHNSQASQIGAILTGKKDITLNKVSINFKVLVQIGIVALVIGVIYGGYTAYQAWQDKQEADRQAEIAREVAKGRIKSSTEYPKTWQEKPHPMDVLYACQKATEAAAPKYLGWNIDTLQCGVDTGLTLVWKRAGTGNAIVPADGKATVDSNFTSASLVVPIEPLKPRGEETLAYYGLIDQMLTSQNFPVQLSALPDDTLPPPPDKNTPPPPPPKWRKRQIVFNVKGAPWLHPELFDSIPGLIISSIKSQGNMSTFTVEGIIYENRQP